MVAGILEYAALAIFYSLLAAALVEALLYLWRVEDPPTAMLFRLQILALPPLTPLLFTLLGPDRSSPTFRQQLALLDLRNWLDPASSLSEPSRLLLLTMMAATTLLLVAVDGFSFLQHLFEERNPALGPLAHPDRIQRAISCLTAKGLPMPTVLAVPRGEPTAYTVGLLRPSIHVTMGLVELLDEEELEGVLAHEMAHVRRRDNGLSWLVFALRLVSFYNPVALLVFHQIGHDGERVCDAEAAGSTGKPLSLASALIKVYRSTRGSAVGHSWPIPLARRTVALENRARRSLVEDRVERLIHPERIPAVSYPGLRLAGAAAAILALCYFVV